jgi:hypothetical protein
MGPSSTRVQGCRPIRSALALRVSQRSILAVLYRELPVLIREFEQLSAGTRLRLNGC